MTQFCFQTAGGTVEAGDGDGTVGLGGVAAHILVLFHHNDIDFILGQLTGNRAAYRAGTDHNYICFQQNKHLPIK